MTAQKLGFVGLGMIGGAMAKKFPGADYDREPESLGALGNEGGGRASRHSTRGRRPLERNLTCLPDRTSSTG